MINIPDLIDELRQIHGADEDGAKVYRPDVLIEWYREAMRDETDLTGEWTLEDIEEYLSLICKIFPEYTPAQSELAHCQTNYLDKDRIAIENFTLGIQIAREQLIDLMSGLALCHLYRGEAEIARRITDEFSRIDPENPRIAEVREHIKNGPQMPFENDD